MTPPLEPSPESRKTRPEPDPRLDPEAKVFGLAVGDECRAWPLEGFGRGPEVRHVAVGGQSATLLWDGRTRTAVAYAPEAESHSDQPATLEVDATDPGAPWVDAETGSHWSIAGRAISGPRKGQTLRWLPGVMVKWYAWSASYPATALEGDRRRDNDSRR
jgi:hypothetical protein